jgi:Heliorhodopsin
MPSAAASKKLRSLNIGAGTLHLVSAILILVLANNFSLPVVARYEAGQPGLGKFQLVSYGSVSTALLVGLFFLLSALAHFTVAFVRQDSYLENLDNHRNPYRWLEYSLSSSIMIFAIAQITGVSDIAALIALVGLNASMIGFGWMQERYEGPGGSLQPFYLGCIAGALPWVALGLYLFSPGASQHAPGFVYGIYFSIFVLFNCFALVQWLQYKQVGRFKDYLVGERTYIYLSFVAKSLLAWQIFASVLAAQSAPH